MRGLCRQKKGEQKRIDGPGALAGAAVAGVGTYAYNGQYDGIDYHNQYADQYDTRDSQYADDGGYDAGYFEPEDNRDENNK